MTQSVAVAGIGAVGVRARGDLRDGLLGSTALVAVMPGSVLRRRLQRLRSVSDPRTVGTIARGALFASTALVGMALAVPAAAQQALSAPAGGGTITANDATNLQVNNNTGANGGYYVGNIEDENHPYHNRPITLNSVTINATATGTNSGADALYASSVFGNSNQVNLNGTNNIRTTVDGGAAIHEYVGANGGLGLSSSGSTLTGSYGILVQVPFGFYGIATNGYTATLVGAGTHVAGISVTANSDPYGGVDAHTGQFNISGFDTGITVTTSNGAPNGPGTGASTVNTSGGGTISANTTGIAVQGLNDAGATVTNGSAIVAPTGISATTNGGVISITTVAGGTINSTASGTGTGIAVTNSGGANPVTVTVGASIGATTAFMTAIDARITGGTGTISITNNAGVLIQGSGNASNSTPIPGGINAVGALTLTNAGAIVSTVGNDIAASAGGTITNGNATFTTAQNAASRIEGKQTAIAGTGSALLTVNNYGRIIGDDFGGTGQNNSGAFTLNNFATGVVAANGGFNGTYAFGAFAASGGVLTVANVGLITSKQYAVYGSNSADTVTNSGTIEGGVYNVATGTVTAGGITAINLTAGGTVTNNAAGLIVAGTAGVSSAGALTLTNAATAQIVGGGNGVFSTGVTSISNNGLIGTGTVDTSGVYTVGGAGFAIQIASGSITNTGTLNSTGASVYQTSSTGTLNLVNTRTIGGAAQVVNPDDTVVATGAANVLNSGTITTPNFYAVSLLKGGTVINAAGGVISAGSQDNNRYGVFVTNASGTIDNYGTIRSTSTDQSRGIQTDDNAAMINLYAGSTTGSILTGAGNDALTLYNGRGTAGVATTQGYTDAVSGAAATVTLQNAGTLTAAAVGAVDLGGGTNTLALAGTGDGTAANGAVGALNVTSLTNVTKLVKQDSGTWTLTGGAGSDFTGGAQVNGGRLIESNVADAHGTGGVQIASSAVLQIDNGTGGVLRFAPGTISGLGTLQFTDSTGATNSVTALGTNGSVFVLLSKGASFDVESGQVNASSDNQGFWSQTVGGVTTYNQSGLKVASGAVFDTSEAVVYADDLTGGGSIQDGTSLTLGTGGTSGSFTGIISGNGTLTKTGVGTQTLTGANTYTGATTISGGMLALSGTGSIANSSVADGATFDISQLTNGGASVANLTGNGSVKLGAKTLTLTGAAGGLFSGIISDGGLGNGVGGQLAVDASGGTFTLTGANTYTGLTTVNGGTLALGNGGTTGSVVGNVALANNSVLQINRSGNPTIGNAVSGTGTVEVSANAVLTGTLTNSGGVSIDAGIAAGVGFAGTGSVSASGAQAVLVGAGATANVGGTVSNTGSGYGIAVNGGGTVNVAATGVVQNSTNGNQAIYAGTTISVDNYGTIQSRTSGISAIIFGNGQTAGQSSTITNEATGKIAGMASGINASSLSAGTLNITNMAGGQITGTNYAASISTATAVINNYGFMVGGSGGISSSGFATITNTGTIGAGTLTGTPATFTANGNTAIAIAGGNVTNGSIGNIAGSLTSSGALTLSNAGSMNAVTATGAGVDMLTLRSGSTTGAVTLGSGNDSVTIYNGTGSSFAGVPGSYVTAGVHNAATVTSLALGAGTNTVTLAGGGTEAAAGATVTGQQGALALNTVSGLSVLTKTGSGNWVLSGAATGTTAAATIYAGDTADANASGILQFNGTTGLTGAIYANGPIVQISGNNALGTGTVHAVVPTLTFISTSAIGNAVSLETASGATTLSAVAGLTGTLTGAITTAANAGTATNIDGQTILAAQAVTVTGGGTIVLGGANSWTGLTTVTGGSTLSIAASNNIGTGGLAIGDATTAGTLTTTNAGAITIGGGVTLGTGGATISVANAAGTTTLSGVVSGSALTKTGAGTLTLSGNDTYTGATTITAGTLALTGNGSIASSSGVVDAGTFDISGVNNGGTTIGGLSGAGAVVLGANTLTLTNGGTYSGVATGTGGLTVAAGDEILTGNNSYTGTTTISGGSLTLGNGGTTGSVAGPIALTSGVLTINHSNAVTLAGAISGGGSLVQAGTGTTTLSGANTYTGTTTVSAGTLAVSGGAAIADVSAVTVNAGGTLQLLSSETIGSLAGAGNVVLGANTLTTGGLNASPTFSGVASGSGGITKVGTGTLTLAGANTYTGATTVSAGTLALGATNAIGAGSAVAVASGATLTMATYNDTVASLALAGTLAGTGTLTAATYTLNGAVVNANLGAGTLNQASGTSTLNGTSAAATVNINGGTLATGSAERIADNAAVTIASGALLSLGGAETIGSLAGAGNVALGANTLTTGGLNASPTFSGVIAGAGGLTKVGTGTLTLSGVNSYTGATTINAGTLAVSGGMAIADASAVTIASAGTLQLNNSETIGSLAGAGNVTLGANTLTTGGLNASPTFSGVASGTGGITKVGTGTLTLAGANTYTGATTVSAGTLALGATNAIGAGSAVAVASGATLTMATYNDTVASLALAGTLAGTGTLTAATYTLNGAVVNANLGAGTLNQASGTSTLNGTSAAATVNINGGTLATGSAERIADNAAVTIASGALLSLGGAETIGSLAGAGNVALGANTLTTGGLNASPTFSGVIAGAGGLTKVGTGTLTLSGVNSYTGATTINAGTLAVSGGMAIADASAVTIASAGTLQLNNSETIGSLAGAGNVTLGANTLTTGGLNASPTFSGVASGTGGITKVGTGTLTLSGANTFTGTLEIAGGTVAYGANNVLADTVTVLVDAGATFNLNGYSDTIGTLNLYGTLSNGGLLTATTYNAYAGSTIGQAISSGTLNVYGNTSLTAATAANPVNINSGTLTTASAELLSDTGAINIASGGTLALGGNETIGSLSDLAFNGTTNGGTVQLGANTLIVGGANTSTGFSGTITDNGAGTGSLTKTGTGTLILSGANSYNGTTTVSGGTLQGTTTSIVGSTIVDNATLAYNQSASGTVSQGITGSGIVTVAGLPAGSALTFTGTNSQTGGFAVTDASTVAFTGTNGGAPTEVALQGAGTLVNTGMLTGTTTGIAATAASGTATILNASTGTIVGASYGVQSSGAGTLALTNYGTITGPVSALSTGANVLSLRAGSTTGAVTTGSGDDTLVLYTGFVAANPVVDATTGLTLRAAGTYAAASFGAIDLGAGANVLNLRGMGDGAANGAASSIDLSTVANAGTITKQDAGTWTLTGAVADAVTSAATINAGIGGTPGSGGLLVFARSGLTGTINVNGATIRATAAGAFGTGTINAIDPTIQYAATGTYANPIVLQSTNPTSDPTTLQTFGTGITATLSGTITQANAPQPLVFSSINTNGSQGTGTFVLTNAGNAWTGVTTVSAGTTLRGTTATLSGASFTDNGVLNFNQAAAGTSARAISGTGTVLIDGGGPVTLTGAITAAGGVQIGANTTATLSNVSGNGNTTVFLSGNNAVLNVAQGGTITATNGGAVFGTAQNGTVNNAGTVTSTGNFSAIFFNPNLGTAAVTNTGTVNAFGSAIYAGAGTALSVTNSGTLTSTNRPAILANTATITNTASGVMTGFFGVYTNGAMTLANAGQITAAGAGGNAVTAGGGSIVNTGTLTATTSGGWGVLLTAAGSADNQGTINADSGMVAAVSGVTFSNEGTINAAVNGVWGLGSPVTLTNNGTINAGTTGVLAEAAGSSITNSGTIAGSASGAIGVAMAGGTLTNQSGGVISAGQTNGAYGTAIQLTGANNVLALQAGSTVNGLIDASATTDGSNGYTFSGNLNGGFTGGSGNDTVTLVTPVTVTGTLDGGAGTDTLVLDGTGAGTLGSAQVVNFENGVKQGSGTWTLTGTTAASPTSFAINAGTLAVAGGNALADNGAVTIASGATLQLNNSETIGSLAGAGNVTLGANTLTTGGLNASPTFSGVASGTGGLTKIGTGTLTLAGVNTYTGATTVSAGTLAVSGGNAIADTSAVTIAAAGTLQLNASETIGSLSGAGNVALGANTLTTGGLNASPTFSGVIAGGGGLTKVGTGTLTLSGVNTYTGATTINAGTLAVSGGMAIADASAVAIASGATLQLNNSETIGSLAGAGNVTLGANTLTTGGLNASPTFSGVASGTGGLTKIGTGTLTLAGANTYTGATTVSAGTLALGATNAIGAGSAVTVASGATLNLATYNDTVASLALNGTLAGTGTLTAATYTLNGAVVNANLGAGTLNQAGGTSVLNGTAGAATVNVNGGTLSLGANDRLADNAALTVASGATLNMGAFTDTVGTAALNGTLAGTGTLTAATYTLNGAVVNANLGAGTLNQAGGTSVLNGTAGAATVNVNGGTLSLGANDRLADNATVLIATGAALNMATFTDTVGLAQIAGMLNGTGTLTAAEYDLSGATVNANLGTGNLFQQAGTSTLNGTSNAANVMITGGTLVLGASNRLADTAAVGVATGATLNIGANTDTVGTLALNGTLAGTGTLTATTYTLNNAAVNANLGTGTLVQASGTSVLSGTAATNMVAVMAGTLRLGASDRIADAATLGVASGATFDLAGYNETVGTLAGSGTLSLGAGTLTAGGTNADYAFGGNVTGTGDLAKVGTGTFSLIGNEAMTGRLNVNAGTLMLAGTTAGSVRVQGGTLTGASTIAGNLLLSSGTLSPGIQAQPVAAIQAGSLTVTGGTTVFDFGGMASGFTADLLKVTGAATLTGGTVTTRGLDPSASYKMEQVYTVVQAGTLTGTYASGSTFTQVSNNSDLYYRLRYDLVANGVVLEVRKPVDFTTTLGAGATGNQLAVARALNGGVLTGSDAFVTALNAISQLSPDQRRSTLDNLGGESIADISTSVALVGNRFNELLRQRVAVGAAGNSADPSLIAGIAGGRRGLDQVRASGQVGAEGSSFADGHADNHAGAWVQTFGGAGTLDGLGGTASIKDQSYGVAAGIDAKVAGLSIGGAFAASALDTRVEGRSATNRGTLYQGGGYVAYDDGTAYASAVGSYFSGDVTSTRQVYIGSAFQGTATGTPRVTGYTAGGSAGYRLPIGGGVRFTPQASFQATHVARDAFTETGAGVLSLSAARDVLTLYTATAEGRLSYLSAAPGGIVEPYVGAGAAFAFGDLDTLSANRFTGAPTGTGVFSVTGARLSPTTALVNGGIEAHPNDRVTLGMGVEGRLSNRQRDGRVELHVRLGF